MHKNHRKRMKERFLAEGLESFSEHNVLEFLLFFAIPRKDTNEIAHKLIDIFGSLAKVLDANVEDLMQVGDIGEHAAILLKTYPQIAHLYVTDSAAKGRPACDTVEKLCRYAVEQYVGITEEVTKLLLLDNTLRVIGCADIGEGSPNQSGFRARKMVETAIRRGASTVVLMHNHPDGRLFPSDEDLETTFRLQNVCEAMEIKLLEHVLVAGGEALPILHQKKCRDGM